MVHPLRAYLVRKHTPPWLATVACVLVVYLLLLGLALALLVATARFAALLPTYADEFNQTVENISDSLRNLGVDQQQLDQIHSAFDFGNLVSAAADVLGGLAGAVSDFVFILMLILFMTLDAGTFPRLLARMQEQHGNIVAAMNSFARGTRSYLVVSTVFGFIVAVIDTIALAVMGLPVPLLWGLLSFITNYIPNIGFIIGLIPPTILALLEGGPGLAIAVVLVYSVANLIIQSVIQPKFVGSAVGLSTSLTFVSLVLWAWVLGALGALLAIPLTLLVKALLVEADPGLQWLIPLISNRDPEAEAAKADKPKMRRPGRFRGGRAAAQP
jgi:AI-2 transport protein TqsA